MKPSPDCFAELSIPGGGSGPEKLCPEEIEVFPNN